MTFGEKLKQARLSCNLSQKELAQKTGISERSLYAYEQNAIYPRSGNVRKLADALNTSPGYLLDEDSSIQSYTDEAADILTRVSALFACRELDDEAKDSFFRSLMEAYLNSKKDSCLNCSPKERVRRSER